MELREVLAGLFGADTARSVFPRATPQDPVVLERFAGEVVENLRKAALPEARIRGAQIDKVALSAGITASQVQLSARLEAAAREGREAQDTLAKKNRAIEDYDRIFRGVALTLTGLFTLAGEEELANKVRPSARRPGQTEELANSEAPIPAA